ncbi:MAG: putative porin [Pseudohongiellaceae bacterium]|jgi:predicted porin
MYKTPFMALFIGSVLSQTALAIDLNVYGVGHVSMDSIDDDQDSTIYLASNSSRLGVKGQHQLDDDLIVIFQYESGVDLTGQGENDGNGGADSRGELFTKTRPSFVGLSGRFGKVLIGHMPALDQWANDYNLFADQVGDLGNLWEGSGVPGRIDDTIHYATPNINGFNAAITYMPEEGVNESDSLIFKADYANPRLKTGLAYASIGQGASTDEHTAVAITVGYYFDHFSVGGGYQTESDVAGITGRDRDSFTLGGSIKLSDKTTFKVQYAMTDGNGVDSDAKLFAIGLDYALYENTLIYAAYSQVSNDDNVNFSVNGKGHGDKVVPLLGGDPSALSLGIVFKFDVNVTK